MSNLCAKSLSHRIESEYRAGGYGRGWRFLYNGSSTLACPNGVIFLGLHPGGTEADFERDGFAVPEAECAWLDEAWAQTPKNSRLPKVFEELEIDLRSTLAANFIPFRSPRLQLLPNKQRAIEFCKELWQDIVGNVKPRLILTMGRESFEATSFLPSWTELPPIPAGHADWRYRFANANGISIFNMPNIAIYQPFDDGEKYEQFKQFRQRVLEVMNHR